MSRLPRAAEARSPTAFHHWLENQTGIEKMKMKLDWIEIRLITPSGVWLDGQLVFIPQGEVEAALSVHCGPARLLSHPAGDNRLAAGCFG
jgi:hypothetical protein